MDDFEFVRKAVQPSNRGLNGVDSDQGESQTLDYLPLCELSELSLRPHRGSRRIKLLVVVTAYNEPGDELERSLKAFAANISRLELDGLHYSEIYVLLVLDGRVKMASSMQDYLVHLKIFDSTLLSHQKRGHAVIVHFFERTVHIGGVPLQMGLALKERNGGKLHSHLIAFKSVAATLNPKYVLCLDVGTAPAPTAIVSLYREMERQPHWGGAAGEITVRNTRPWHMLEACQIWEYASSHILDKASESQMGFISVLPGAFR